jgi:4-deoxy-L-threo-5-hexosulose-uronate ketol-isomerase
MKTIFLADPQRYPRMTTQELRDTFLLSSLLVRGELHLAYIDLDRTVVGMAAPLQTPLALPAPDLLRADHFLERRELGALNIGGKGKLQAGSKTYNLDHLDCLYLGRGQRDVSFSSEDSANPAIFYLLSYPAHKDYPTTLIRQSESNPMELGTAENANRRTICKYIHQQGAQSCQLVMGVTHLHDGSVWNTMPPHTHLRRSEVYMYFNLGDAGRAFHLMGPPQETRHLVMSNCDVAVSPGWSIHAGAGTQAYSFCWGMGGENQDYADMDAVSIASLL